MSGSDLCIPRNETARPFPKQNYNVLSPNFHIHVRICERFIYSEDRSQIHERRNWERYRAASFLGIYKSAFRYSVPQTFWNVSYSQSTVFLLRCFRLTDWFDVIRVSQKDVVYLGWPIAPSYMGQNATNEYSCMCTWSPNKLWRSNSISDVMIWNRFLGSLNVFQFRLRVSNSDIMQILLHIQLCIGSWFNFSDIVQEHWWKAGFSERWLFRHFSRNRPQDF